MEGSYSIPSHAEDLTKCMYELQQDGTFCDAGLECKDGVIFVHKLVLMACRSPYLRNQLMCESQGERVYVSLKNYSLKTVCRLVQTLYTGQLNISQENEVDFRHLCETIELDNIKSAAENFIQQDQIIYEVESVNQFCAVQVEEEIIESQDGITALVASVNHGPDDNLVDSTNTVDNVEYLNNDISDVKVGGDTVERNQDSEGERETNKSLDPPTMATGRETRSNKRRKIFHNENPSQAKDNATSSNMAEILTIAKQLSGIDEAQPSKSASSYLDQTKSSLCSLCTKEFVNKGENVTDPGKPVCTECMVLFSGETNDDQEMGTKSDQTQSDNSEDGGGDSKKDSVALEEECLKKTCEEGSPLPEEADSEPLPWLQDKVDIDGCEKNVISDRKLRYKSQSDKGKTETGETIQEKMWHCKKCEFSTCDKKEHERHRKRHTYIERKNRISKLCKPPKYSCDECRNEYKTKCGLIHHKKIAHSNKPILRCLLTGCKTRFVEESALQKHMVWHNCQGVLKCRKCAKVFVLKGALERHEDYCIKRVMFRCDICNKVYKGQKDLADHVRKLHGKVKGFKYWKSVHLEQHDQEHDYNDAVTYSEAQVPSKIEGININDKTTKPEGDVDNVDEFVKEMNSIILTQKNKKKLSQTKDVYRCTKCDFATDDKRKYNSHRGHHNYEIHKQRSAEPQTYTCDKCKKEYKTSVALKSHTKKVHTGTVIFECPQKGCFKHFTNQHTLKDHVLEYEESGLFKCVKCAKSFITKHNLKEHEDSCTPNRIVPCDTAPENSGEIISGDDRDDDNDDDDDDEEEDDDDDDDIENIVKTLNKAINKKSVQKKVFKCKRCNFSAKDKKYYSKHLDHHMYLDRKQRTGVSVPKMYICSYCGLTFRSKSGLSRHELNYHSDQFLRCKVESCRCVYKEKQQLKEHTLKHKHSGLLKCTKCDKKYVDKSRLTRHEDSCIRNMTTYEQAQCHICEKQFLSSENEEDNESDGSKESDMTSCSEEDANINTE
ncbi:uncharacterized protein LOC143075860 isoform X2 [Mytilus galloprovincialis]|uniref:uncharacterized protein LOC143075860 isoform X2 n=1 Tax=Mytilus galloprovincialis TaxID=29158 RepID=UPI003F7BAE56